MRRLWWSVIVLAICVVSVGFYRGWFVLTTHRSETGRDKIDINLTVDQDKMKNDGESVKNKAKDLTGQD